VSPCYETDCSNLAPAFILTAEFDPLIDDGLKYSQQLKKAGNIIKYKEYKGLVHGFFNIPKVDREAMQAYYDIQEFIRELL
jgi:acetyl esterase